VPTSNDDATDESATEATVPTGRVATTEGGISEIVPSGDFAATD